MNLKLLRQDLETAGYEAKDLADYFGCHRSLIYHIFSGRRKLSVERFEMLYKLAGYPPCRYLLKNPTRQKLCQKTYLMDDDKLSAFLTLLDK